MCKYTHFDCPVTPSTIHDCDLTRTSALSVQSPARVPGSDGWPVRRSWWWQNGLGLVDVCPLPLLLHHHQQMQLLAENQPLADRDRHRCCHGSTRWRKLEQLKVATNAKFSQLNVILPLKINETNYCQCKKSATRHLFCRCHIANLLCIWFCFCLPFPVGGTRLRL